MEFTSSPLTPPPVDSPSPPVHWGVPSSGVPRNSKRNIDEDIQHDRPPKRLASLPTPSASEPDVEDSMPLSPVHCTDANADVFFMPDDPDHQIADFLKTCDRLSGLDTCYDSVLWNKIRNPPSVGLRGLSTERNPYRRIRLFGSNSKAVRQEIKAASKMRDQAKDILDFATRAEIRPRKVKGIARPVYDV